MADPFVVSNIRRLPLFARMTPEQVDIVAEATQVLRYESGQEIMRQGEAPPGLFVLVSGSAVYVQRGANGIEQGISRMAAGGMTGESALFTEAASPVSLRAAETTIIIFLSRQQIRAILSRYPDIAQAMYNAEGKPKSDQPKQFDTQNEDETVLLKTRHHIWFFWGRALTTILLMGALWVGGFLIGANAPGLPWGLFVVPATALLLLLIGYHYLEWFNDLLIVTDQRVINIQRSIRNFNERVNEIPLDAVSEVATSLPPITDVVGRLLNYGTLIVKTSGDSHNLVLNHVTNPKSIQQLIFTHREEFKKSKANASREAQRRAIRGEIEKFLGGRGGGGAAGAANDSGGQSSRPGLFSIKFTNDKGETVYRKHWFVWWSKIILPAVFFLGGAAVLFTGLVSPLLPLAIMGLCVAWMYLMDWDWRNDLYIIGDQTITIIRRRPLFLQDQKDQVLISQVDNVVADTKGLINSLLQIGEVRIMLSGTEEQNAKRITSVHHPRAIQQEIASRRDKAEEDKKQEEAQRQRQAIVEYLSVYHETIAPGTAATAQPSAPPAAAPTYPVQSTVPADPPPRVRDRSRPPGIPRAVRRDGPHGS